MPVRPLGDRRRSKVDDGRVAVKQVRDAVRVIY
jgi:hypothetical protein